MKIQSTPLTFIDQTDSRKLEVYIKSNLPTVQIRNSNTGAYTPDWREGEKLILTTEVFLDSRVMTTAEYTETVIKWYKDEVSDSTEIQANRNLKTLQITTNELASTPIITYICEATYQGITVSSRITFVRVDTGRNGEKGADGTSVRILGTAKSAALVPNKNYYTIVYDTGAVVAAELGDAYVLKSVGHDLDGHLFVCALLNGGEDGVTDYFIDAGQIQGPEGDPAKTIALIGSAQVFKVGKDGKTITPKTITITAHTVNIDDKSGIKWEYKYDTNATWTEITGKIVKDADSKTIISINNSNDIATVNVEYLNSHTSIALKSTYENAEDAFTLYKVFDGVDGEKGNPGEDAPIAFLSNEHISFVADANGNVGNQTVYTSVIGYRGATREKPILGDLDVTNAALELIGMKVEIDQEATDKTDKDKGEVVLKVSVASEIDGKPNNLGSALSNNYNFSIPVISPTEASLQLNWTKINSGADGVGIRSVQVKYGTTQLSDKPPQNESDWKDTLSQVVVPEGHYLWTRTLIDYTDDSKDDTVTYTYAKQGINGAKGDTGTSVSVTEVRYKAHSSATKPPEIPIAQWSVAVEATSATLPYLWTRTIFSDGKYADSVARYGTDGAKGDTGTPASLVDITPSAYFFKSTTGKDGVFTPDYIYLYPRFQTVTYGKWEYSTNGTSWTTVTSGSNGLTIGTYNSVANSLQIAKTSGLYTDSITSVSFRCVSSNATVYDTVSIAKIYDVVDLQIGGRNLAEKTNQGKLNWIWAMQVGGATISEHIDTDGTKCCKFVRDSIPFSGWSYMGYNSIKPQKYMPNTEYTVSFEVYSSIDTIFGVRLMEGNANNDICSTYNTVSKNAYKDKWSKIICYCKTKETMPALLNQILYLSNMNSDPGTSYIIKNVKIERGNKVTDWTPAPEDLIEEASNVNVMLSNEAHFFEATASGIPKESSIAIDIVGYKGSVRSATTVGTIVGKPSAGMTTTVADNGTTNTKLTIAVTQALTSDVADYGILTIPITVNGHTINKTFSWTKAKEGNVGQPGDDAVTFQVYSNNGYALSTSVPTIELQTFAYIGDVKIKAGATYQWYRHDNTDWVAISGATNDYFNVSRDDVSFSNNYMCKMYFNNTEYVGVVTIEDKNDEHRVFASKPSNYFSGDLWVVGTDYIPSGFAVGSMLRSKHANATYADLDWELATRYDNEIDALKAKVATQEQYVYLNATNGLRVGDATIDNNVLSVGSIETSAINTIAANIESPLTITGRKSGSTVLQRPVLNIDNFSLVIEDNGSFSIIANT